jgi:hypothetical protein
MRCTASDMFRFGALKGPIKKAQGNALGKVEYPLFFALKGHDKALSCALSGQTPHSLRRVPRALPWADLFEPFGLQSAVPAYAGMTLQCPGC